MTFRTKQRIDFWVGGMLLLLLFLPVRVLALLLRRDHTLDRRQGCAVVKLVGAGSLFLALPALQSIRGRFPAGRFYLITTPALASFAKSFDWFDECLVIDDSNLVRLLLSTARVIVRIAFAVDHLIDIEVHSRLTTVFGVMTAVRNRIGFVDEIVFWRRAFYTHMVYFNTHGPVYAFYDTLAGWFGIDRVLVSKFHDSFRASVIAQPLPAGLELPPHYVAIGPACSDLGRERMLRPDEWKRLLAPFTAAGTEVVILGGPSDSALADTITSATGSGRNLCGQLSLAQAAKIIANSQYFYGIDSLLLHLARAIAVPSASFWGPSSPATRLRPLGLREQASYVKMPCSPCIHVHESPPCGGARPCIAAAVTAFATDLPDKPAAVPVALGWISGPYDSAVRAVSVRDA